MDPFLSSAEKALSQTRSPFCRVRIEIGPDKEKEWKTLDDAENHFTKMNGISGLEKKFLKFLRGPRGTLILLFWRSLTVDSEVIFGVDTGVPSLLGDNCWGSRKKFGRGLSKTRLPTWNKNRKAHQRHSPMEGIMKISSARNSMNDSSCQKKNDGVLSRTTPWNLQRRSTKTHPFAQNIAAQKKRTRNQPYGKLDRRSSNDTCFLARTNACQRHSPCAGHQIGRYEKDTS